MSIIQIPNLHHHKQFQLFPTNPHTFFPPQHFHQPLIHHIIPHFKKHQPIHFKQHLIPFQPLKQPPQKPKIQLSTPHQTEINLPYITIHPTRPKHFTM
ncbi:Hsp70 family protein, partial [Neisseria sicca]|uniref:Hsp70 family protein n=1 Tax=Neisseria sicca TaxID=490 RepID=UPI0034D97875